MARECGVSRITWFPMVSDEGAAPKYKEPIGVPWAVTLETEDEYTEGEYYGDNIIEKQVKTIASIGIDMEVSSDLPPAKEAEITGKGYKNGKKFSRVGQNSPAGALAYEILMDDNTVRRRVIYNVGLTRNSQKNKTSEGEGEGETFNFEGKGIPLRSTKDVELTMDEKEIMEAAKTNEGLLDEWNEFFERVIMPDGQDTTVSIEQKVNK